MSDRLHPGDRIVTTKGSTGAIVQILDGGVLLDSGLRVRSESIVRVLASSEPTTDESDCPIQIGTRLRRHPRRRVAYPDKWFGKDGDDRSHVVGLDGMVTGFTMDGYSVVGSGGGNYRVSDAAIECGEWEVLE
jgi:hypothetical protein